MEGLPKLLVLALVAVAFWYFRRWFNEQRRNLAQHRAPPPAAAIEDLVRCGLCGAYVAPQAPACGRRDCPRPR
jgi:hypothetical protein